MVAVILRRKGYLMTGAQEGEGSPRCLQTSGLHFLNNFFKVDQSLGCINQEAPYRLLVLKGEKEIS